MALALSITFFVLLLSAITYAGHRYYARPARYYDQLGATAVIKESGLASAAGYSSMVKVFQIIGRKVPISPTDAIIARRYLIAAGHRSDQALYVYYGIKFLLCGLALLGALAVRGSLPIPGFLNVIFVAAVTALGFWAPNFVLERMVSARQDRIKLSLPDALDLTVVCVEAGLGLDQAILNVSKELLLTHKDISEELDLVTLEMQAGKRRAEALRNLADRTGQDDLRKLVAILVQTDRFGTSMADSLRTHADYMRVRRRQEAEERAGKLGVKLVFPIFFFILPAMFIVVSGPGLLQIFKQLFPLMRSVGHH